MSLDERVMVVSRETTQRLCGGKAGLFTENVHIAYDEILQNHTFLVRAQAEQTEAFQQIIPYVLVHFQNKFLLLKRKKKQTEIRLHLKYSLGIGGHLNPLPPNLPPETDPIFHGMQREFAEELHLSSGSSAPTLCALLYDDQNSVSRSHLGLVYLAEAFLPHFSLPEAEKMSAEWADLAQLHAVSAHMETWAQLCLPLCESSVGFRV